MDRLSAVIVLVALTGCEEKSPGGDPPSRVNGAKTTPRKGATVEAFCDYAPPETAKPIVWPGMDGPAPASSTGWRWLNIWATWCKPCVEEMPRLVKWQSKLGKLDLTFVSVDESADDIAEHKKRHPDMPATLRLSDSKASETWFRQLGAGEATLPLHIFIDAQGRIRCVRSGSVTDGDLPMVEKLLAR